MLSQQSFQAKWKSFPNESQTPETLDAAWRRYQHVFHGPPDAPYPQPLAAAPKYSDPDAKALRDQFTTVLATTHIRVNTVRVVDVPADRPPWRATGLHLSAGVMVSTFATGRIWRNKLLDLWLGPQFGLWFKVGVDGRVFNGRSATNTFRTEEEGELFVGTQFPGQFGNPLGGRVQGPLGVYDGVEGGFRVVVCEWGSDVTEEEMVRGDLGMVVVQGMGNGSGLGLIRAEVERLGNLEVQRRQMPEGWSYLWFLGESDHFTQVTEPESNSKAICCRPHGKAGILQKRIEPNVSLGRDTVLRWEWLVTALPSRLREDLTISHDYLSIAVEFDNGRDLTYTWSWELPVGFGYWCPLGTWSDREYHIVLRSGTGELRSWLAESRNVFDDYKEYIGGGNKMPSQIVRVWLIAGSRWQRHLGEMTVRAIWLEGGGGGSVHVV